MKKLIQLAALAGAALMLGACSTINSRIQENAGLFYSLDPNTQSKLAHGDIDLGFSPQMVYIALGQPDLRRSKVTQTGQTETWIYRSYFEDYAGTGMYYHRWGAWNPYGGYYRFYWEPSYIDYYRSYPQDDIRVTFQNGRVITIDQART